MAYAGSHGVHLPQFNTNINQIPDSFISQAAQQEAAGQPYRYRADRSESVYCPLCNTPNAFPARCPLATSVQGQLDRPYPQYTGLNLNGYGCCSSNYNSLQATVTKRFHGGGTMLVAYTNSKLMSNTDTLTSWLEGGVTGGVGGIQDWNNLKGERSLSSQDVSQRLAISYVLDLPFGRGKKYMGGVSGFSGKVVSGWGLDGVTAFQRGFPVKISYGQGTPLSIPDWVSEACGRTYVQGCDKCGLWRHGRQARRVVQHFLLHVPPVTGLSVTSRAWTPTLRQEGAKNFDFAVFKKTTIAERAGIEFRTEFFNLFNHPQFGPPNGTCCLAPPNGNFGQVTNTIGNPRPDSVRTEVRVLGGADNFRTRVFALVRFFV